MKTHPIRPATGPAQTAWRTREAAIRDAYLAAVDKARRRYDMDTAPALAAYNHAERTAWIEYMTAGKANWHAYVNAASACESDRDINREGPADIVEAHAEPGTVRARPSFTPTSFPEGDQP